jgi:two-component sensor histidine kinase
MTLSRLLHRNRGTAGGPAAPGRRVRTWLRLLALVTILPPMAFGAMLIALDYRSDYEDAVARTQATSRVLSNLLDQELSSAIAALNTLAATRALRDGDLASFYEEAVAAARQHPEGFAIGLADSEGHTLLHTTRPFGAAFGPRSDLAYIRQVVDSGKPMISDVVVSSITRQPVVAAYIPVPRPGGPPYVLGARLTVDNLLAVLRQPHLPEGALAAAMDGSGTIVARTLRNAEVAGKKANPAFIAGVSRGLDGHLELTSREGVPILSVWARSPLTGWTASISLPRAQLTGPVVRDMLTLATGGLVALVLGLLGAALLARRIEGPLARLAADAAALDGGAMAGWSPAGIVEVDGAGAALAGAAQRLRRRDAERDAFEARQRLLLAELDHRVKNTLAGIQAIARQSLPAGAPKESFIGRVQALAGAHGILAQAQWHGASMARLVSAAVGPYCDEPDRLAMAGPDLVLSPKAAQAMTLVLHELATNAAKYGALSTSEGRLEIAWQVAGDGKRRLRLGWRESGGPPVEPPGRAGFGTRLITQTVAHDLDGKAELHYRPEGLRCDIDLPLAGIERSGPGGAAADRGPIAAGPGRIAGRRILVVEDSALLAAELAALLGEAGCQVVGPAATLSEALALAGREALDGAILDVDLDGQAVFPAAELLRRRAVPLVFVTGYGGSYAWPAAFAGAPRLPKPVQPEPLLAALASAAA